MWLSTDPALSEYIPAVGKATKEVERVDKAHQKGGQNHVHLFDGTSLNQDGSIHDAHKGVPNPSNASKEWLKNNGWNYGE